MSTKIKIINETEIHEEAVNQLIFEAFAALDREEPVIEHLIVQNMRKHSDFVGELAFVAEVDGVRVASIHVSKSWITNNEEKVEVLTLAPVAVHPNYQNKGIGGKLIERVIEGARSLGFGAICVLGHAGYYPKFGFEPASKFGVKWQTDDEPYFMILELTPEYVPEGKWTFSDVFNVN